MRKRYFSARDTPERLVFVLACFYDELVTRALSAENPARAGFSCI